MAYAATKADGDLLGSWWSEDRGGYIQPTELLLGRGGTVLGAIYASGPVGRMGADEAIHYITYRENIRREEEEKADWLRANTVVKGGKIWAINT